MTVIEFYEKDELENICSGLACKPERVILIGGCSDERRIGAAERDIDRHIERYEALLEARDVNVEFQRRVVDRSNMQDIIETLAQIVNDYDDCVFDLTGGEDLFLVAVGIVFEANKHRGIQMHRFNIRNNTIVDADQDGRTISTYPAPELSTEELIRLYGGRIVYDDEKPKTTFRWDLSPDFMREARLMWNICRVSPGAWNAQLGVFAAANDLYGEDNESLSISVPVSELKEKLKKDKKDKKAFSKNHRIIDALRRMGLLTAYECGEDVYEIAFKNRQIKRCLTTEGLVLELKMYLTALETRERGGETLFYNDAINGAHIDWDGEVHTGDDAIDTENEIDVLMMRGMIPVFVSCKNGGIEMEELYKLDAVAARFGGKYAKRVLVASALGCKHHDNQLRARARDMGIHLVEGNDGAGKRLTDMDDEQLKKLLRTFC